MENEIWKKIKDYDYEVSDLGNIRNMKTGKVLKPVLRYDGHLQVSLCNKGKQTIFLVSRLVLLTFCPIDFDGEVFIIDGNKSNVRLDNLKWIDYHYGEGKKVYQYDLNDNLIRIWNSAMEVQRETNFKQSNICASCNNKYPNTKNIYRGYKWSYAILEQT